MKREKAIFATVLITAMLIAIMAFLFLLGTKGAFFVIGGVFAIIGIFCSALELYDWLAKDDAENVLEPVEIVQEEEAGNPIACAEDVDITYEEIRDAVRKECGGNA